MLFLQHDDDVSQEKRDDVLHSACTDSVIYARRSHLETSFVMGSRLVHCGMLSSIPGPYTLDDRHLLPGFDNQKKKKNVSTHCRVSPLLGRKSPPTENHCPRDFCLFVKVLFMRISPKTQI